MFRRSLYRNIRSAELLEIFLVSAISSVLLIRLFLELTGYPQLGGAGLHIAHMLYGGLFMLAALVVALAFLGRRAQRLSALSGGLGFGFFIDELGKFITSDNNYFFQPTIALLYITFIGLFFLFRQLGRQVKLDQRSYLLNAIMMLEEAVIRDMDAVEKQEVRQLLRQADKNDPVTRHLSTMIDEIAPTIEGQSRWQIWRQRWRSFYQSVLNNRFSTRFMTLFFGLVAAFSVFSVSIPLVSAGLDAGRELELAPIVIGQLASALVAAALIYKGVKQLDRSRLQAYEFFKQATLINIFFTQFFDFYREEFSALPIFIVYVGTWLALNYVSEQEKRHQMELAH